MSEQAAPQPIPGMENPNIHPETVNGIRAPEAHDISMTDAPAHAAPPHQLQHPPTSTTPSAAPSPLSVPTARVPTPVPIPGQHQHQQQPTSRATSQHPDPSATTTSTTTTTTTTSTAGTAAAPGFTMPSEAAPHGAPVRQYINGKITGVLLEGMKMVAREQPKDPLRVLGEFLLQRSKELEGKDGSS